jgi:hypothetical protein
MNVTRRSPHPLYGNAYELQTFECRTANATSSDAPMEMSEAARTMALIYPRSQNVRTQQAGDYSRCDGSPSVRRDCGLHHYF